ncbi:CaiB/BaiF CoA transferase family protein [Pseudomaricurvus sp.]|uniref:CaiB/BaiF CoA transferase family protein n=1 Tax=Pseudomaricurvus sp. TaxID=2004510 RepID=UPI003F6C8745
MSEVKRGGPLEGVRVIELTKVWAGPYTGKQLAFLGAEVIRIESLGSLDVTRVYGVDDINNAPGFKAVNPQKLSAQIDMKTEAGIKLLLDLLAESDVVVENLRPGAVSRLGLGYDQVKAVNPNIIYVSMGMYGSEGPLAYQTGYAPCFAALGGLSSIVGYEDEAPTGMNIRYADSTFGTAAAYATIVALLHRRRTGEGQFIDVSAVETMTSMIGDSVMDFTLNNQVTACTGNHHSEMAPHGVYPCQDDEWIAIAVSGDHVWQSLTEIMGRPELARDPKFSKAEDRISQTKELDRLLSAWTSEHRAEVLAEELQKQGVAATKSLSSLDLIANQTLWMRGFYQEVSDKDGHTRSILGPSWKMSRMAEVKDDAPQLGQHNDYVFGEILGLSEEQRAKLSEQGVIR